MRGSQLWREAVENNLLSEDSIAIVADSNKGLGNFTREELINYTSIGFHRFYFRIPYMLNQIYRGILRNDFTSWFYGMRYLLKQKRIETLFKV